MRVGILSDTHNELTRTKRAVELLLEEGAEYLIHCGDLAIPEIVHVCAELPFVFVFGNHDCDQVPELRRAAKETESLCLEWGGEVALAGRRIAVVHGHLTMDLKPLLAATPDYLLSGHTHEPCESYLGSTRRINPGALFRTERFTVALLDLTQGGVRFITIDQ